MELLPLFVLVGPTAVGKTKISIELAQKLNGEIISGDSMQVYKYLDIGTAKIKPEETKGIPHYLIDIKEPTDSFSVAEFQELAKKKIKEIAGRDRLPMLVGGTGLYINSVINDYSFSTTGDIHKLRSQLWKIVDEKGIEELIKKLKEVDPKSAQKLHPNDHRRIIRAMEVYCVTGKPISSYHNFSSGTPSKYRLVIIGLNRERHLLYQRINTRVEQMLDEGWLAEVKGLLAKGIPAEAPALQGLGYKQLIMHLQGHLTLKDAVELIKRDTRRFAKRQLTWFKRDPRIYWINMDENEEKEVINEILTYVGRSI
ncbi:MAG: tRNA dimethylallyltransferase [Clostridia bacterium]|nr:tRNA dimethylallyltransferase [Clostridia bacterium]MDN5323623.1 tRNA dimethylallyltransferase [Clostridia bacterium]